MDTLMNLTKIGAGFRTAGAALALAFVALVHPIAPAHAQTTAATPAAADPSREPIPEFPPEYLADPAQQDAGKVIWDEQCTHCHGRNAYPGKAPKLRPAGYKADFVYDRISFGFRKMPAWNEVYTKEERMALVAYILSKSFSP